VTAAHSWRWWSASGRPQITTPARAIAFLDDAGFALLFARRNVDLPNLWDLARDDPPTSDWGPDIQRVWKWKDEFPRAGKAWYGHFLAGQKSFLSPELLGLLYPRAGAPDDFTVEDLTPEARAVADVLLASGPTPSSVLREAVGLPGKAGRARFTRALTELGRALVVTHYGTEEEKAGWPSAVIELTARAFRVPGPGAVTERRGQAAAWFVATMEAAHAKEVAKAFGWPLAVARTTLDELHQSGAVAVEDGRFVRSTPKGRRPIVTP
jgi:hypothetical protein